MPKLPDVKLQASPNFVQAHSFDGRNYVAQDVEPYTQFWLSERERLLLALFSVRGGCTAAQAFEAWFRLQGSAPAAAEQQRLARAVAGMRQAGVLLAADEDTSRYDKRIVADYIAHRPFPQPVVQQLVRAAGIGPRSRVLDLAGGPGDLALALARHSEQVSMMELSRGFVAAARRRAKSQGLALQTLHDSCNRLLQRDEAYDAITIAQALHWLDDVQVCRGVCRLLQPGGSFFVIHSAIELPDTHPLAYLLGHDSVLGAKPRQAFVDEVAPLQRRLALLFQALDAPEVQRIDPAHHRGSAAQRIGTAGVQLFRQQRPFDAGYARGFLTPQHIALTGQAPADFWAELHARCAAATPAQLLGTHHWALLHFQRGAAAALPALQALPVQAMAYEPPAAAL
jgi:2-polyprenyl-3-methyl-5-hydroxy-6-metoxy-1,4-benzoquinol methylase